MNTERCELKLVSREPRMCCGVPEWWHRRGMKMCVDERFLPDFLLIGNNASRLKIYPDSQHRFKGGLSPWHLDWTIRHSAQESVTGAIMMSTVALKSAFACTDTVFPGSHWLIEKYGGKAAEQGSFIRWENFLNIPGPGTGHDGDPNISILLDDDIRMAAESFIQGTLSPQERKLWA